MGNTRSMSSINASSAAAHETVKKAQSSWANDTKRFYLNLSELKSGLAEDTRPSLPSNSLEPSPSSSYTDEYTNLNEIIDSIESFSPHISPSPRLEPTDNYADLDLDQADAPKSAPIREPQNRLQARPLSLEVDSQLYSNVNVLRGDLKSTQRRRSHHFSPNDKNTGLVSYLLNMNLTGLQITSNFLGKLGKNAKKRKSKPDHQKPPTEPAEHDSRTSVLLISPPQKCFDPCEEFETRLSSRSSDERNSSTSTSTSISLSHDTSEELEGFYQSLRVENNNNTDNNKTVTELSDYDYLVSYEWPRVSGPPPPPASTQPSRTQAILKFYEYY